MQKFQLTRKQLQWLITRGDREPEDVIWKNGAPFVEMVAQKNYMDKVTSKRELVRVPTDSELEFFIVGGKIHSAD